MARRLKPPELKRPPMVSGPEIEVSHSPAGRDTLAVIASELTGSARRAGASFEPAAHARPQRLESGPEIEIGQSSAGHETLAAIASDIQQEAARLAKAHGWQPSIPAPAASIAPSSARPPMSTLGYDERPNRVSRTPEVITIETTEIGRHTLSDLEADALASALGQELRISELPAEVQAMEVFEMVTFVVRASDPARLSSMKSRVEFVKEKLMHRLPISSPELIDRVDVTPWTEKGTLILRVWCRVA